MPPPLSNLGPGDPIPTDRTTWNALMLAGRVAAGRAGGSYGGPGGGGGVSAQLEVWVRNDTGGALAERAVVALGSPVIDATSDPLELAESPTFPGTAPAAATDAFAILTAPASDGELVRAAVLGVAVCDVDVSDAAHGYAAPSAGVTANLASAATGPAKIVWKAGTSGTVRAVVLLQGASPSPVYSVATLAADYTLATNLSTEAVGLSLDLAAGVYLVCAQFWADGTVAAGDPRVYGYVITGVQELDNCLLIGAGPGGAGGRIGEKTMTFIFATGTSATIYLAARRDDQGVSWTTNPVIRGGVSPTRLTAVRLDGGGSGSGGFTGNLG